MSLNMISVEILTCADPTPDLVMHFAAIAYVGELAACIGWGSHTGMQSPGTSSCPDELSQIAIAFAFVPCQGSLWRSP
jgi:hypothetical protein